MVPNELLETSEFKSFISSLNSFPVEGSAFASSMFQSSPASEKAEKAGGSGQSVGQQAPPNTPNTTRPPSTTAEVRIVQDQLIMLEMIKITLMI